MKMDEYGEVLNSPETFQAISHILHTINCCLIGWTDEEGTHFDILFTYRVGSVPTFGRPQGGVQGSDLFVSIMRVGTFGFDIDNKDTHWTYFSEKLTGRFGETTGVKIAELINGVKKALVGE